MIMVYTVFRDLSCPLPHLSLAYSLYQIRSFLWRVRNPHEQLDVVGIFPQIGNERDLLTCRTPWSTQSSTGSDASWISASYSSEPRKYRRFTTHLKNFRSFQFALQLWFWLTIEVRTHERHILRRCHLFKAAVRFILFPKVWSLDHCYQ